MRIRLVLSQFVCGSMAFWGAVPVTSAQVGPEFALSANASIESVSNANETADPNAEIDEAQTDLGLRALGRLRNAWSYFDADATIESRRYATQSEEDENVYLGELLYHLGAATAPVALELSYSSEEISIDPTLGRIPQNKDSREIASASLLFSRVFKGGTRIDASVQYYDVAFDLFTQNSSERQVVNVALARIISPIFKTGLRASAQSVEFKEGSNTSELTGIAWFANWQLRRSQYGIELGRDTSDYADRSSSSISFAADANFTNGVQAFELTARQWLSDTSIGNGNVTDFSDLAGQDGRLGIVDQYVNRDVSGSWRFANFLGRGDVTLGGLLHQEAYEQFSEFDSRESRFNVRMNYPFARKWRLFASYALSDVTFDGVPDDDYADGKAELGVASTYVKDLMLSAYVAQRSRQFEDDARDYTTHFIGLNLKYDLYAR